ncbi:phosphotransferase family protein [Longispora urticae]
MVQTHDLTLSGDRLVKRYVSWERGEHRREWAVLNLLHAHTTDLAPPPLAADLDADPPRITMGLLPGAPLDGALTPAQLDAMERALRELWSVPVGTLPPRRFHPAEALENLRGRYAATPRPAGLAGEAYDATVRHLSLPALPDAPDPVLGHSDPNLANYLWDGTRIRIVDFEDAGRSDIAYELATLVEHLSARATDWKEFCARFDVRAERFRAARILAAALWLHMLLPGGPAARRNPPGTLDRQARRVLDLSR